jgi:hypothetical protein
MESLPYPSQLILPRFASEHPGERPEAAARFYMNQTTRPARGSSAHGRVPLADDPAIATGGTPQHSTTCVPSKIAAGRTNRKGQAECIHTR